MQIGCHVKCKQVSFDKEILLSGWVDGFIYHKALEVTDESSLEIMVMWNYGINPAWVSGEPKGSFGPFIKKKIWAEEEGRSFYS